MPSWMETQETRVLQGIQELSATRNKKNHFLLHRQTIIIIIQCTSTRISLTLSELYRITMFSYGIWICGYEFLDTSIQDIQPANADVFPIVASLHLNGTFLVAQYKSGDRKYICIHRLLNKLLKTTVLIHVFCYNSRSTCNNRDLYLCHYLLIPQWKFLCDIYMNLTDDSEVIISEVNSIKLLRV